MDDELNGWAPALEQIARRKSEARSMGGEARLDRQRQRGRLNARERLAAFFDSDTFFEIGNLVGTTQKPPVPGDALVAGFGRVNGRSALAGAEDVTVLGGSIGSGASDKRYRLCQLALQERVPLVMMLEGAGHRVTESAVGRRPGDLMGLVELSGRVPMVCLVLGASAGHGALTAPLCDFVVMTETASIFAAGPPLVKSATGEDVTKEALGGPDVAVESGGSCTTWCPPTATRFASPVGTSPTFPSTRGNNHRLVMVRTLDDDRSTFSSSSPPIPAVRIPSGPCSSGSSTTARCSTCNPISVVRS